MWYRSKRSSCGDIETTRRVLRFMRLEKRLMLSGDFGESFETDDEFEFDDELHSEYDTYDDHDSDDDDHKNNDDHDDEYDDEHQESVASFSNAVVPPIRFVVNDESPDQGSSETASEDETEPTEIGELSLTNDPSEREATSNESLDEVDGKFLAVPSDSLNSVAVLTRQTETDVSSDRQSDVIGVSNDREFVDWENGSADLPMLRPQAESQQQIDDGLDSISETSDGIAQESALPIEVNQSSHHDLPRAVLPVATEATSSEELDSTAIVWLGSFADDLSAVDEALSQFFSDTSKAAAASVEAFAQPAPLLTTGLATAAIAAHTVYRRKRAKDSQLENDFYAVRFDVRLYPEIFG